MAKKMMGLLLALSFAFAPFSIAATEDKSQAAKDLERRQKVEMMSFLAKDPKDAQLPQTAIAVGLYNQAVEHFQRNDYDLARQAIAESLRYDGRNSLAFDLLGNIDYLEQKLADAKFNYTKAYEINPTNELKEKIEKLRSEALVERGLSTYRDQHFIIKYHDKEQNIEGFELRELLRDTYRNVSKDFAYYFKHQVVVLLYDEADFKKLTNAPHWAMGIYDGKIRMPINRKGFSDRDLRALTAHEVTHAFVGAISGNQAPAWINEGLAEHMEAKIKPDDVKLFQSALKSGKLYSVDELMNQATVATFQDPVRAALFYEQSANLTGYLVKRYGMFRIKQVLEEFGKGKNSDEALRNVLRLSPERLEKEWKEEISK